MKQFYSYDEFSKDIKELSNQIKNYSPDALISIARGGMTMGHFISEELEMREIYTINSVHYEKDKKLDYFIIKNIPDLSNHKKIILLDDISDSGETLQHIIKILQKQYPQIEIKTATIFYKNTSVLIPDFKLKEATKWIVFFWEKN